MGKPGQEPDFKSELVAEICSHSTWNPTCIHRQFCSPNKSHFIDWYRLLGVEEDAGTDIIRKRYHRLALHSHPDKNKHPKSEIAFKLISEAYTCLTDEEKRRAFDIERERKFCFQCRTCKSFSGTEFESFLRSRCSGSNKILQGLRKMREKLREEARVIESCLRVNAASRTQSAPFNPSVYCFRSSRREFREETPIFNPSDYMFQGYPHLRSQVDPDRRSFSASEWEMF